MPTIRQPAVAGQIYRAEAPRLGTLVQAMLDNVSPVPLVSGEAEPKVVAAALDLFWNGPEKPVVVSSDLSHYLPYEAARTRDRGACSCTKRLEPHVIGPREACCAQAVNGRPAEARRKRLEIETPDLGNSVLKTGSRGQIVDYGAWIRTEGTTRKN